MKEKADNNDKADFTVTQWIGKTGKPVANHLVIRNGRMEYFQSYNTTVVRVIRYGPGGKQKAIHLDPDWNYNAMTIKYVKQYLTAQGIKDGTTEGIKTALKNGQIRLEKLN